MKVLVDTNVVVRAAQPNSPDWPTIEQALSKLIGLGGNLCLVPQNLYELWVVATRPTNVNGFGLDASAAASMIDDALTKFQLMRDERGIFDNWLNLIQVHQINARRDVLWNRSKCSGHAETEARSGQSRQASPQPRGDLCAMQNRGYQASDGDDRKHHQLTQQRRCSESNKSDDRAIHWFDGCLNVWSKA